MKTKTYIPILTLLGLFMMSCASSSQVGKTSSWGDEIYGSPAKPQTSQLVKNEGQNSAPEKKANTNYANLEQKYSDVIEFNMDSIKNDTVIYKAKDTNPYSRILSDSYQESYERRLRGIEDPYYRLSNWFAYNSDDYWYAQAYDPYFYRTVVMGSQVWVEPWYISAMFGWPRTNLSMGYSGFYFHWNYPYLGIASPWYSSPYWSDWHFNWPSYTTWCNPDNNVTNNYYYGRRSGINTQNAMTRRSAAGTERISDPQTVSSRRSIAGSNATENPITSSRRTQTRVAPTYEDRTHRGNSTERYTATSNRSQNKNTTQTQRPTRNVGVSEPTRRSTFNSSTSRYRSSSSNKIEGADNSSGTSRQTSTTSRVSNPSPTYNRPGRVSTPPSSSNSGTRSSGHAPSNMSSGSSRSSSSSGVGSSSGSYRSSGTSNSSSSSNSSQTHRNR